MPLRGPSRRHQAALSVAENLAFWADYLGGGVDAIDGALAAFGLAALADVSAAYLSAGQRRRLGLARILTAPRPMWLLDEPTVSLDKAAPSLSHASPSVIVPAAAW